MHSFSCSNFERSEWRFWPQCRSSAFRVAAHRFLRIKKGHLEDEASCANIEAKSNSFQVISQISKTIRLGSMKGFQKIEVLYGLTKDGHRSQLNVHNIYDYQTIMDHAYSTFKENNDRIDVEGLAAMLQVSCMLSHAFCRLNSRVSSLWVLYEFSCIFAAFASGWFNVWMLVFLLSSCFLHTSLLGASFQEKALEHILYDLWKAMDSTLSFRVGFFLSFAQDLLCLL